MHYNAMQVNNPNQYRSSEMLDTVSCRGSSSLFSIKQDMGLILCIKEKDARNKDGAIDSDLFC